MMDVSGELSGALIVMVVFYLFVQSEEVFRNIFIATLLPGILGVFILLFFVKEKPIAKKTIEKKVFIHSDIRLFWLLGIYFFFLLFFFYGYFFMGFVLVGLFIVVSLNSMRSYIASNASSKAFIYGIFYMGTAFFSSGGALLIGKLWELYGFEKVFLFSFGGMMCITLILLINIIYSSFLEK